MFHTMALRVLACGALATAALCGARAQPCFARAAERPAAVVPQAAGMAVAQDDAGGSAGGSAGKPPPSPPEQPRARRSPPEAAPPARKPSPTGGNYDGLWTVVSVGETCSGGSRLAVVISSGRITGVNVSGSVNGSGSVHAVYSANGITSISSGRLSGRSGSGRFKQSDGCVGHWSAVKQ
jgi:hypothetical protein